MTKAASLFEARQSRQPYGVRKDIVKGIESSSANNPSEASECSECSSSLWNFCQRKAICDVLAIVTILNRTILS